MDYNPDHGEPSPFEPVSRRGHPGIIRPVTEEESHPFRNFPEAMALCDAIEPGGYLHEAISALSYFGGFTTLLSSVEMSCDPDPGTRSSMKNIAAYILLTIGGNAAPTAADVKALLATVDITADDARLDQVIAELAGKDLAALIAEGSAKLASVPSGGASASAAPAAAGAAAAAAPEKVEEKVEEKEESDDDMGFGLFD